MNSIQIGRWGEQIALEEYKRRGFSLVAQNWRYPPYEIDLIVEDEKFLVFCEVKTRRGVRFGSALEALGEVQMQRLMLAAEAYLAQSPTVLQPRMDVCAIQYVEQGDIRQCRNITIIENAFA